LPARSSCGNQPQQDLAIASCLAQAEALCQGQSAQTVQAELKHAQMSDAQVAALTPHKVDPGGRPVSIVLFAQLDPATLGRLIALYEHSVLTQSVIWGINAFDQWGVELGKKLTSQLVPAVTDPAGAHGAPPTVLKLLATVDKWRGKPA
jgi:glucose-6-phosphate isomerase